MVNCQHVIILNFPVIYCLLKTVFIFTLKPSQVIRQWCTLKLKFMKKILLFISIMCYLCQSPNKLFPIWFWPGSERGLSILFSSTVVSVVVLFSLLIIFGVVAAFSWFWCFSSLLLYSLFFHVYHFHLSVFSLVLFTKLERNVWTICYLLKPKILVYLNTKF